MSSAVVQGILDDLKSRIVPGRGGASERFFKTGQGEYGEGDQFWGITVPSQREVAGRFASTSVLADWENLTVNPVHEVRLTGWLCVVLVYKKEKGTRQTQAFQFTKDHVDRLNNWDLVDSVAPYVLGPEFYKNGDGGILNQWARSENLWVQRASIMSTFAFIREKSFDKTFEIAEILMNHSHDLIHKAVGWMIREVGNRDMVAEEAWLKPRYKKLPRTMLRYAIEKFPEDLRKAYIKGGI